MGVFRKGCGQRRLAPACDCGRVFGSQYEIRSLTGSLPDETRGGGNIGAYVVTAVGLDEPDSEAAAHAASPCRSSSNSPFASRAKRSSQQPMWRSPMKICGTELRPARWRMAVRTWALPASISSYSTPLLSSRRFARMQKGQKKVV